jgi:hypothetical protein
MILEHQHWRRVFDQAVHNRWPLAHGDKGLGRRSKGLDTDLRSRPRSEAGLDGEIFSLPLRLPRLHLHPGAIATIFRTVCGCQECVRRPYIVEGSNRRTMFRNGR